MRNRCNMVANRDSIVKVGSALAELVIAGGGATAKASTLALEMQSLCAGKGVYKKQYASHEERVMYRHLNLYQNKLNKARTEAEKVKWQNKLDEQNDKIELWKYESEGGRTGLVDLDLDDL